MRKVRRGTSILIFACALALGQATEKLTFEVASVRSGEPGASFGVPQPMPGGVSYVAANSPLMVMVMKTYRIMDNQVSGAPRWMIFDPWVVNAKAAHPSTLAQLDEMFQNLLADRFKLRFHREAKEAAAYVLSVEKSGSKLKPSSSKAPSDAPIHSGDRPGERVGIGASISDLCWYFAFTFDAPVVNQTGLNGLYDFTLQLPTQETPPPATPLLIGLERNADLITALREQLGLKLEYRKVPVEFLVIDHVERPSDN